MNIYSNTKQDITSEKQQEGNKLVSYNCRTESLRIQIFGLDFTIPFTTRYYPEKWEWAIRQDGGYSCHLIGF